MVKKKRFSEIREIPLQDELDLSHYMDEVNVKCGTKAIIFQALKDMDSDQKSKPNSNNE